MPIYEYVCSDCNLKFELLRALSQANEKASCPRCHKDAERILSRFAAVSKDETGQTTPVSNPCSSCTATSCGPCGL